jgi:hypothetical protein
MPSWPWAETAPRSLSGVPLTTAKIRGLLSSTLLTRELRAIRMYYLRNAH